MHDTSDRPTFRVHLPQSDAVRPSIGLLVVRRLLTVQRVQRLRRQPLYRHRRLLQQPKYDAVVFFSRDALIASAPRGNSDTRVHYRSKWLNRSSWFLLPRLWSRLHYVITELKNVQNMVTLPRNKTLLQTLDLAVFLLFKNLKIRPQWRIQGAMLPPPAPLFLP